MTGLRELPPKASFIDMPERQPRVDVIVLNWNGRNDTLECLKSLKKCQYANFAIRLVDNGSSDQSVSTVRDLFHDVVITENGSNLGFAEGNNKGILESLRSNVDFILLLNNDTTVDPELLTALVDAADRFPQAGVFGAKMYYYSDPKRLWYAGGYWDAGSLSFNEYGSGEIDSGQYDTAQETEWVIGCAMFVRAEVFRKIGLLEPKFFLNNEEIDFCSRAKRAGFACVYVPQARLWHKISVSFGGEDSPLKVYFSSRNRLLWARRNASLALRLRIYADSTQGLLRRFSGPLLGRSISSEFTPKRWWWSLRAALADPRNKAAALGFRDFWLGRFGDCPEHVRALAKEWAANRPKRAESHAAPPQA